MRLKAAFIDIDNTLLDFDAYVRQTMEKDSPASGFALTLRGCIMCSPGRTMLSGGALRRER